MKNPTEQHPHEIRIQFPSEAALMCFASWMSDGGGESSFMDATDNDCPGEVECVNYHAVNPEFPVHDKRRYGPFMADRLIVVKGPEESPTP